ncbi:MAG: thioredoxin-disulfide reductase [Candidatus Omnitrophica bacterium]|nr:thioredoxin-disulfide reductase [Candidatus Omnitrophota bacterium]
MNSTPYETVIIGAGPAGLTACLYALRSRMKTLLIDKMAPGGYLNFIQHLENYPGFPQGINGSELAQAMVRQLEHYEYEFKQKEVTGIRASADGNFWLVDVEDGEPVATRTLIIATGTVPRLLDVPGEKEFLGRGVSYCGVCDAPFFRNKDVVCVGGGNTALEEALYLTRFARSVTLVHRREQFRAEKILQEHVQQNGKITCVLNAVCTQISGDKKVRAVTVRTKAGQTREIACDGVFVFVGLVPTTGFVPDLITRDAEGYIRSDDKLQTSARGIFACGDCRTVPLRQVVTACGEGAIAAYAARKYLEEYF